MDGSINGPSRRRPNGRATHPKYTDSVVLQRTICIPPDIATLLEVSHDRDFGSWVREPQVRVDQINLDEG